MRTISRLAPFLALLAFGCPVPAFAFLFGTSGDPPPIRAELGTLPCPATAKPGERYRVPDADGAVQVCTAGGWVAEGTGGALPNISQQTVLGRAAGAGTGQPSALTASQLAAIFGTPETSAVLGVLVGGFPSWVVLGENQVLTGGPFGPTPQQLPRAAMGPAPGPRIVGRSDAGVGPVSDLTAETVAGMVEPFLDPEAGAHDNAESGLDAVTIKTAIDELAAEKLDAGDAAGTLIGGVGPVPDLINPNSSDGDLVLDDPLDCPQTGDVCSYYSTTSGWWLSSPASGFWIPVAEETLFEFTLFEDADWVGASGSTRCVDFQAGTGQNPSAVVACSSRAARRAFARAALITSFSVVLTDSVTTTQGCLLEFARNNGTIVVSSITIPSTQSTSATHGTSYTNAVSNALAAGVNFGFRIGNGPNCQNGSGCSCNDSSGLGLIVRVRGIVNLP